MLGDERSRRNFSNRLLYDMTGNVDFAFELAMDTIHAQKDGHYAAQERMIAFTRMIFKRHQDSGRRMKIVIFGTALTCCDVLSFFSYCDMRRAADILCTDNDAELWGKSMTELDTSASMIRFWGAAGFEVEIVPPHTLKALAADEDTFVIVAVGLRASEDMIVNQLKALSFSQDRILALCGRMEIWLSYNQQYFDSEFIPPFDKDSVFIDGGAYDLISSVDALAHVNGGRVIAFEPDDISYRRCLQRVQNEGYEGIELVNACLYSRTCKVNFTGGGYLGSMITEGGLATIDAVALDDYLKGEPASYIKMDIEGSEMDALKGAARTIVKYKPVLGICAYHKPFDTVNILLYAYSLRKDYRFFVRHYNLAHFETVVYAV